MTIEIVTGWRGEAVGDETGGVGGAVRRAGSGGARGAAGRAWLLALAHVDLSLQRLEYAAGVIEGRVQERYALNGVTGLGLLS
jgi:hypothetical protein